LGTESVQLQAKRKCQAGFIGGGKIGVSLWVDREQARAYSSSAAIIIFVNTGKQL
jgi:hypothetical protein